MNYKTYFKDKKIAVIGLGPHGEMLADIKFLLRLGVEVHFFEIRSDSRLQRFVPAIQLSKITKYSFGKINPADLLHMDMIILSEDVSRKAFFLKKVYEKGIPVEYASILFLKLAPAITLIGVLGASGKSTVTHMLYGILKKSFAEYDDQGLYFIDPDLPHGALTHLKKIKAGDVVLARIPEDMMLEYQNAHISPHVAVITSLTAHALRDTQKAFALLDNQTYNNFVVAPDAVVDAIKKHPDFATKAKMLRTKADNSALAIQTAELFKVDPDIAQKVVDEFSGLKGHIELVKKIDAIEFYNDASSTNPVSTLYALRKIALNKNIILIFGGAYTGYDYEELFRQLPEYVSNIILLPGSASIGIRPDLEKVKGIILHVASTLEDAVILARGIAKKGDRVLFSPGCEAIGIHISRKERGEKFVKAVRSL